MNLGLLLVLSCTTEDNLTHSQEDNFYALKVGNSWVYKNYRYISLKNILMIQKKELIVMLFISYD